MYAEIITGKSLIITIISAPFILLLMYLDESYVRILSLLIGASIGAGFAFRFKAIPANTFWQLLSSALLALGLGAMIARAISVYFDITHSEYIALVAFASSLLGFPSIPILLKVWQNRLPKQADKFLDSKLGKLDDDSRTETEADKE